MLNQTIQTATLELVAFLFVMITTYLIKELLSVITESIKVASDAQNKYFEECINEKTKEIENLYKHIDETLIC